MCAWTVTGIGPLHETKEINFDNDFETHMMDGSLAHGGHTGLHSLDRKQATQGSHELNGPRVNDDNCPQIFSAKVKLKTGSDAMGRSQFGSEKLSSFFPTGMSFDVIKQAVTLAYQNYHGRKSGMIRRKPKHDDDSFQEAKKTVMHAHTKHMSHLGVGDDAGTVWAGLARISHGANSWTIIIGSPNTGGSNSKIRTAYPTVRGRFL